MEGWTKQQEAAARTGRRPKSPETKERMRQAALRNAALCRPAQLTDHDVVERFWKKVDKRGPNDCWNWTASTKSSEGYGNFSLAGRMIGAHRIAFQLVKGPIPAGLELDHLCRNPTCVNPAHLEAVTRTENARRAVPFNLTTHCGRGHERTEENTFINRAGHRRCRICDRDYKREWQRRKRAQI